MHLLLRRQRRWRHPAKHRGHRSGASRGALLDCVWLEHGVGDEDVDVGPKVKIGQAEQPRAILALGFSEERGRGRGARERGEWVSEVERARQGQEELHEKEPTLARTAGWKGIMCAVVGPTHQ